MNVVAFLGPTLPVAEARALLDATYLPPAAQGDVYRAALDEPWAIVLIDGYFERLPAVWHKEILWAMREGVHVFGASSLGALRAAELSAFGMIGHGRIFDDFQSGRLTDDDEVAIAHGDASAGYRNLSVAMVDIRATIEAAAKNAVVSAASAAELVAIAKRLHYRSRSFEALRPLALASGLPAQELAAFFAWLPRGRVRQKKLDALALLEEVARRAALSPGPMQVDYHFEHTNAWEQVVRRHGRAPLSEATATDLCDAVLEELRLDPSRYQRAVEASLGRALALGEADRRGVRVEAQLLQRTLEEFRRARGLLERAEVDAWLREQELDTTELGRLLQREARLDVVRAAHAADVPREIVDQLRLSGEYGALVRRAREKREALAPRGLLEPALSELPCEEAAILRWYSERTNAELGEIDDARARALGYADRRACVRALAREYLFTQIQARERSNSPERATLTHTETGAIAHGHI